MKIRRVTANNRKKAFEVTTSRRTYAFPFAKADPRKSGIYAYERSHARLGAAYEKTFKANRKAWTFFKSQAPWYQRTLTHFVVSAKREETRLRRLATLIAASEAGRRLGLLTPP